MVVLPFMPRYIGTLNVTHRDFVSTAGQSTPPSPLNPTITTQNTESSPKTGSPMIQPSSSSNIPIRTVTPLPEVQIDKNRHVHPSPFRYISCVLILDYSEMVTREYQEN